MTQSVALEQYHERMGARMVPFAGFRMPLQYTSALEEAKTVRKSCGLFDVSHMGQLLLTGPKVEEELNFIVTNNVARLAPGQALYTVMCYEEGGIVDDLVVYCLAEQRFLLCVNAANIHKDEEWIRKHLSSSHLENISSQTSLFALQGPLSESIALEMWGEGIKQLGYYHCCELEWEGEKILLSRTGYTGEDGFELYLPSEKLEELWQKILKVGEEEGIRPIGLGARDTLRLEAAMPLYGHEITEETNPLEAGLSFAVKFKKGDFIGREALLKVKQEGVKRKLVCLEVSSKRIARQGAKLFDGEQEVGFVTSGTFSPFFQKSIAMGYVPKELAKVGQELSVQIGKKLHPVVIVPRPFYKRSG